MPGALQGVIKEIYPKRGVIESDRGKAGVPDLWKVDFDKAADNLQTPNLTRRYTRGDKVYFLGASDNRATLVCPKRDVFEGTAIVDFIQPHHGRAAAGGKKQNKEVFFTLQRLTQYFKNSSNADLASILKLGDKISYLAVEQPNGQALKAITVSIIGKEPVIINPGSGPTRPIATALMPSRHSPPPEEKFEGIIFYVASCHAYLWCIKLGFVYMPKSSIEAQLMEEGVDNVYSLFQVGDWLQFPVVSQKAKYNCEYRVASIEAVAAKPEGIDCWMGREPSFDTPQFMARGVGIVGAVPTLEYGIVYSDVLGRIFFRSEHIRARTMPKPLTRVQFTAMIDRTQGYKDAGWRAIEVAPAPKETPARPIAGIRKCVSATVKSHYNKCSWLVTKEVGEIFASCEKDFWIRIDDGDSLVGKTFSAYIVPYPYGQGSSKWRALYIYPKETLEVKTPITFPLPPPAIPAPVGTLPKPAPVPSPPIPTPLLSTSCADTSSKSTTISSCWQPIESNGHTLEHIGGQSANITENGGTSLVRQIMSEQQIASLEEELLELELTGINRLIDSDPETERPFELSGTSSYGQRSSDNGNAAESLGSSSTQDSRCQSNQNPTAAIDFAVDLDMDEMMMQAAPLFADENQHSEEPSEISRAIASSMNSASVIPNGRGDGNGQRASFSEDRNSIGMAAGLQASARQSSASRSASDQSPQPEKAVQKKLMVDNFCQTHPSKEKELLMKIMNNKDLFTACMVKFPDLVFEICKAESMLPSR